jgi:uncharacterized protein (DUF2164 family)
VRVLRNTIKLYFFAFVVACNINPADAGLIDIVSLGRAGGPYSDVAVKKYDGKTGTESIIASLGPAYYQQGIVVGNNGQIFIGVNGSLSEAGGVNQILQIDPLTGVQSVFSSGFAGSNFEFSALGTDIVSLGRAGGPDSDIAVKRYDGITGAESIIASLGPSYYQQGIVVGENGQIFVGVNGSLSEAGGVNQILQIDPVTGDQSVFASGFEGSNFEFSILGTDIVSLGRTSGSDSDVAVKRYDGKTGTESIIALLGPAYYQGIVVGDNGQIFVGLNGSLSEDGGVNQILQIDPVTGDQSVFASGFEGSNFEFSGLEYSIVPLPASVWLFISALAGLSFIRRRETITC